MLGTVQAEINRNLPGLEVRLAGVVIERDAGTRIPRIRLRSLELVDSSGNTIARAPRAAIGIDESALFRGSVVPRELELIGPRIMIKRAISGGFVMGFGEPSAAGVEGVESNQTGKSDHGDFPESIVPETSGAEIIDILGAPAPAGGVSGISSIESIKVSQAAITLFDEGNKAYWNAPRADLVFKRMPYGFTVVANASIQSEGEPISTDISASYRRQHRDFSISARIFNFVPSAASKKIYALSQLARVNVPLSGQAELIATNSLVVQELLKQNAGKEFDRKFMLARGPAHMGVRMGEQNLANWLNVFIYSAVMSGELDRLTQKYLGHGYEPLPAL